MVGHARHAGSRLAGPMGARILLVQAVIAAAIGGTPATADESVTEALHQLFDDRLEWRLREDPVWAMSCGDYRYAARVRDESLAAIQRRQRETQEHLARLSALDRSQLSAEDQLNYDLFEWVLRSETGRHRFRGYLLALGSRWGPHIDVAQMHERVRFSGRPRSARCAPGLSRASVSGSICASFTTCCWALARCRSHWRSSGWTRGSQRAKTPPIDQNDAHRGGPARLSVCSAAQARVTEPGPARPAARRASPPGRRLRTGCRASLAWRCAWPVFR